MIDRVISALTSMVFGALGAAALLHWPVTASWFASAVVMALVVALCCVIAKIVLGARV